MERVEGRRHEQIASAGEKQGRSWGINCVAVVLQQNGSQYQVISSSILFDSTARRLLVSSTTIASNCGADSIFLAAEPEVTSKRPETLPNLSRRLLYLVAPRRAPPIPIPLLSIPPSGLLLLAPGCSSAACVPIRRHALTSHPA